MRTAEKVFCLTSVVTRPAERNGFSHGTLRLRTELMHEGITKTKARLETASLSLYRNAKSVVIIPFRQHDSLILHITLGDFAANAARHSL